MQTYLKYYFSAITKYKVHSPFVFKFVTDIFEDERFYHFMGVIENYRRNLLGTRDKIDTQNGTKTVNQLVKTQGISPKSGAILFKMAHEYKPKTILELGTNLGISSLYQATAESNNSMITLEEDAAIATATQVYFKRLGTRNVELMSGAFNKNLPTALTKLGSVEHLFFNNFWGYEQSLTYFETCLPYFVPNTVFIFRDPYATTESIKFWEKIKQHPQVKLSLDIYDLGFVFFRSEQKEVAHYSLIESWKKPWMIY